MSTIDLWASFMDYEKFHPAHLDPEDVMDIVRLCEALATDGPPRVRPYAARLASRRAIVNKAMDLGIDLPAIRTARGKRTIGRGLLDAWNSVQATRFGSTIGTAAAREAKRRDVKTNLNHNLNHGD